MVNRLDRVHVIKIFASISCRFSTTPFLLSHGKVAIKLPPQSLHRSITSQTSIGCIRRAYPTFRWVLRMAWLRMTRDFGRAGLFTLRSEVTGWTLRNPTREVRCLNLYRIHPKRYGWIDEWSRRIASISVEGDVRTQSAVPLNVFFFLLDSISAAVLHQLYAVFCEWNSGRVTCILYFGTRVTVTYSLLHC
jgi:hypothetical protein